MRSTIISTTSDHIASGGTITGDLTISGDLTVSGVGGGFAYTEVLTGDMVIQDTADDAVGGVLRLQNTRAGGAGTDGDDAGTISFYASDAGSNSEEMSTVLSEVALNTTGSTAGKLTFKTMANNSSTALLALNGWSGGSDASTVSSAVFSTSQVKFPDGTVSLPALAFDDDPNTGWYAGADGVWSFSDNGTKIFDIGGGEDTGGGITASNSDGGGILNGAATNTNPTIIPRRGDLDTGIGGATGNEIALITNSVSRMILDDNSRISLSNNDAGSGNTVFGKLAGNALGADTDNCVFIGENAGLLFAGDNSGSGSIGIGKDCLDAIDGTEQGNIAIGHLCMGSVDEGASGDADFNVALGYNALRGGAFSGGNALTGNIAIGSYAMDATSTYAQTGTIAIGHSALSALTSGAGNTAVGYQSGTLITTGANNTILGHGAMDATPVAATGNVAIGTNSMGGASSAQNASNYNVSIGNNSMAAVLNGAGENVAIGGDALNDLTSGDENTCVGFEAGDAITTQGAVTLIGKSAGSAINHNDANGTVAVGKSALTALTSGAKNVAIGYDAMGDMQTGTNNIALGYESMNALQGSDGSGGVAASANAGNHNIAIGTDAMGSVEGYRSTTEIDGNIAIGTNALLGGDLLNNNIDFIGNIAIGHNAISSTGDAQGMTGTIAIGQDALTALTSGANNVAIGYQAADSLTTGGTNTVVGNFAFSAANGTESANTAIGYNAMADADHDDADNNVVIGAYAGDEIGANAFANSVVIGYAAVSSVATSTASGTVAIGKSALNALTSGAGNTAVGYLAATDITTGAGNTVVGQEALTNAQTDVSFSTAIGYRAGYKLGDDGTSDHSEKNTLVGYLAMGGGHDTVASNTGYENVAIGTSALGGGTATDVAITASANIAIGQDAMRVVSTGASNVAIGKEALAGATTGVNNIAIGHGSLDGATGAADDNVAIGYGAMGGAIAAEVVDDCVAIGSGALSGALDSTDGADEASGTVAIGKSALAALTSGAGNTAVGYQSLDATETGAVNTAVGYGSLSANCGNGNTVLGYLAGADVTGALNTLIGHQAGKDTVALTSGISNICIGNNSRTSAADSTNQIVIGDDTGGVGDNTVTLGNGSVTDVYLASGAIDTNRLHVGHAAANAKMTVGITINQGANDDEALALKSSDVSHGVTNIAETNTYASFGKYDGNNGGMVNRCLSDATVAYYLQAVATTVDTTHTASGTAVITMDASKANGVSNTTLGTDANVFAVKMDGSAKFIVDNEGDLFADGGSTSSAVTVYDEYDDAQLVRALDTHKAPKAIIQSKFDDYISYNKDTLVDAGIIAEDDEEGNKGFVNVTGLQRLHNGAIWQQYTEMQKMKELMYETMVEMIGKDKADQKLKDHDIKLLDENTLLN